MKLTARHLQILTAVSDAVAEHANPVYGSASRRHFAFRQRHQSALEGWAPWKPLELFGHRLGTTEARHTRRQLNELAEGGYVLLELNGRKCVGWLKLTALGNQTAAGAETADV